MRSKYIPGEEYKSASGKVRYKLKVVSGKLKIDKRNGDVHTVEYAEELTYSGSDIADWGKYSTKSVSSPSGSFQMHFYHNFVTGEVYYGRDYKAIFDHQGTWNSKPQPKYESPKDPSWFRKNPHPYD